MLTQEQKRLLKVLSDVVVAGEDVVEQFEMTLFPVGADLADSIRVFLKPAIAKFNKLQASAASVAAAENSRGTACRARTRPRVSKGKKR